MSRRDTTRKKWTTSNGATLKRNLHDIVYDAAVEKELAEIIVEFKAQAADLSEPDELWELVKRTDQRRRDFDRKYDFRYSQLLRVFAQLLRENRVTEAELQGLGEEKAYLIARTAKIMSW